MLLAISLSAKLFIDFFVQIEQVGNKRSLHLTLLKKQCASLAYDDDEMAKSALFLLQGKGFVIDIYFDRPAFSSVKLHKTALRPKFLVVSHSVFLTAYCKWQGMPIEKLESAPVPYFEYYAWWICVLKNVLLIVALYFFYKVCLLYFSPLYSLASTILFSLFPSVCFFVGQTNMIDTLVMPLDVIFFSNILIQIKKERPIGIKWSVGVGILFLLLCYIKPHHILLLGFLNLSFVYLFYFDKKNFGWILPLCLNGVVFLGFLPILYSNYKDFGEVFLSSQSGFNLFHGHNPVARGSWSPHIWSKYYDELYPLLEANAHLPYLNEKQESDFYGHLAKQWIYSNPLKELELVARKVAMFFLPHNFINWKINLYNLAVYVLFLLGCLRFLIKWKEQDKTLLILFVPILGVLLMSVMYFVEYRWRYYAEPFMVFFALLYLKEVVPSRWLNV